MYLAYWGLQKYPFENVPDPEFMYYSSEHEEALARLIYAVKRNKGVVMLTGEIGCGKTMISRVFIRHLEDAEFDIGLITNPSMTPIDFLKEALYQFDLNPMTNSKADLLKMFNDRMMENVRNNKSTMLVVDEAQLIYQETLEEIRLLLNFQLNDRYILHLVLIGQPELQGRIRAYPPLDQRIAIRYHLNPLSETDTMDYIAFRMEKAGQKNNPFTPEAAEEIYSASGGIPRVINKICDLALLVSYSRKAKAVDRIAIKRVLEDSL